MTWLVVGLGNPGLQYAGTRHNLGFMTADELATRAQQVFSAPRGLRAETVTTRISDAGLGIPGGEPLVIAKPRTYMNESGLAVRKLADFYKITPDHIVVVHDELDLDLTRLRLKQGGGDNGHNGLRSIRSHLGTGGYYRVRIGIGRPPGHQAGADYVLGRIPKAQREDLKVTIARASDAVCSLVTQGLGPSQNRFNS